MAQEDAKRPNWTPRPRGSTPESTPPPPPPPPPNSPSRNGENAASSSSGGQDLHSQPSLQYIADISHLHSVHHQIAKMNGYNSPTPQSSGLREPPASHRTMEMRISRNEAELQEAMSAQQSNGSMSVNERDDRDRQIRQMQRDQVELKQQLARCKITIHTQSQIIQKPQSAQKSFPPQYFENRNANPMPGPYPGPIPPPQFDPSGTIATAENALRQSNSYDSMLQTQPSYGSQSAPRPAQSAYNQATYRQESSFPQTFHQQVISPPQTHPHLASLPGTLGYGLTAEQRAEPLTPTYTTNQPYGGYHVQNKPSQQSYQQSHSQPSSNRPSYSSQSSYPAIPQQQATKPSQPMSTVLVGVRNTAEDLGFPAKFQALFVMSERYAFSHINFPSSAKDAMLSSYNKAKLEQVAASSAGNLMSNGQTRYHIVARVMNQWISKHILRRTCFSGLDKDIDANIQMHAGSIYQSELQPHFHPPDADQSC
jgi:hypothetical protein